MLYFLYYENSFDYIILAARNEEKLKKQQDDLQTCHHVLVKYIVCDLTQANAVDLIIEKLDNWKISVDLLVNNAGLMSVDCLRIQI